MPPANSARGASPDPVASQAPDTAAGPQFDRTQLVKLAIDLVPLLAFFATYMTLGLHWATGVLMLTSVVSMIASHFALGKISPTLLMSTALVLGFGALTLYFNDPRFIQMKPTIVYLLFAGFLFAGLLLGKPILQAVLGEALKLTDEGWSKLSVRWGFFFVAMAALNEIVWRNFSETAWASFKVFGFLPLTLLFFASQYAFIERHRKVGDATDKTAV